MTTHVREYKMDEVATLLLDPANKSKINGASQNPGHDSWAGCTYEESIKFLTHGWESGVAKLNVEPNTTLHEAMRPKPLWDVSGSEVDIGSYLAGEPECMTEMVRRKRPSQVVRIGVDKAINCNISKDRIHNMGRNVLILVESLRLAGIPAEIWVCQAVGGGGDAFDVRVCVQEPGRPVDISRLAYWVAHPGSLRRTIFALEELEPQSIRDTIGFYESGGYGYPMVNHAQSSFDEWAPSPQQNNSVIQQWVQDVLNRRAG